MIDKWHIIMWHWYLYCILQYKSYNNYNVFTLFVTFLFALHRPLFSETGATLLAPEANRIAHELSQCSFPCWDGYKTSHGFNEATTRRLTEAMRFLQLRTYSLFLVGWMYIMGYSKKMYIYIYIFVSDHNWNYIYNNLHWNKAVFKETLCKKLQG